MRVGQPSTRQTRPESKFVGAEMMIKRAAFVLALFFGVSRAQTQCKTTDDCPGAQLCVEDNPNYSQCVDCSNFKYSCGYYDESLQLNAEKACQLNCPNTTIPCNNITAPCYEEATCVSKADGSWSQCIKCEKSAFEDSCAAWDDDLRAAAIQTCDENCPGTKCNDDIPCATGTTCVTQADGHYSQCVDCGDTQQFQYDCPYWSEPFKEAAEAACDLTCDG